MLDSTDLEDREAAGAELGATGGAFPPWVYPVVLALFVLAIGFVLQRGGAHLERDRPDAPVVARSAAPAAAQDHAAKDAAGPDASVWAFWRANAAAPVARLALQILVVFAAASAFGALARRVGQPAVVGQVAAGIALGPSLLGAYWPEATAALFPPASLGGLQLLSQLGVILYMFTVGMELSWTVVQRHARAAVVVSHISILVPLLLGVLAAIPLYRTHAPAGISFEAFGLFIGVAMSITALPVLARILAERGLATTPLGAVTLTCAAVDDVSAWLLLALVIAIVSGGGAVVTVGVTLALVLVFVAVMVFAVRPAIARALAAAPAAAGPDGRAGALAVATLFASVLATETLGVHAVFGAFVAGAIMPQRGAAGAALRERLGAFSTLALLPLFFAFTGLRTEMRLLDRAELWLTLTGIILVATLGKLGGSTLAARFVGLDWASAFVLGALMNTRGLMELIALNIGYDLGVITPGVFTCFVLMALVTTAMTGPLVSFALGRGGRRAAAPGAVEPATRVVDGA
jgi:Kef-type K+ transport system membrane component KefB